MVDPVMRRAQGLDGTLTRYRQEEESVCVCERERKRDAPSMHSLDASGTMGGKTLNYL